ncbi:MAG: hypothetical protein Kow006_28100 [Gammaproteobacteria bacterium]
MALVGSSSPENGPTRQDDTASFFYEADAQRRALDYVTCSLAQGRGVFLLSGESGCGKTTLMAHVADIEKARGNRVVAFPAERIEGMDLFRQLAAELGLPYFSVPQAELLDSLERELIRCTANNRQPLLIIDNAEKLTDGDFAAVTRLCEFEREGDHLLQVVLVAERFAPREFISRRNDEEINHLLAAYQLTPLLADEIAGYVADWLRFNAKVEPPAMPAAVKDRLYLWSSGLMGRLQPLLVAAQVALTQESGWQWSEESLTQLMAILEQAGPGADLEKVRDIARHTLQSSRQADVTETVPERTDDEALPEFEFSPAPPSGSFTGPEFERVASKTESPGDDIALQTPFAVYCANLEEVYLLTPLLKAVARSLGHCTLLYPEAALDAEALDWSKGMRRVVEVQHYSVAGGEGGAAERFARKVEAASMRLTGSGVRAVLALNDSDETLALALAAYKLGIPVIRVEAGRRRSESGKNLDTQQMLIDRTASLFLVSDRLARAHLVVEGIPRERIVEVGTLRVDALARIFAKQGISLTGAAEAVRHHDKFSYALVVLRDEHLATPEKLEPMLHVLRDMGELVPVRLLVSGAIKRRLEKSTFASHLRKWNVDRFAELDPIGSLAALEHARLVVTDSDYLQVESSILKIPCITLSDHTPWPMTLEAGSNRLCEMRPLAILDAVSKALAGQDAQGELPHQWDGRAAARALAAIKSLLGEAG